MAVARKAKSRIHRSGNTGKDPAPIAMTFQVKSIVLLNGEIFLLPLPAPDTV